MPEGYVMLRTEIACLGVEHENRIDIFRNKMVVLGGMNYVSVENINKANSNRSELFSSYIEACYPYIQVSKDKKKADDSGSIESLINEYKRIFGQYEESKNAKQ